MTEPTVITIDDMEVCADAVGWLHERPEIDCYSEITIGPDEEIVDINDPTAPAFILRGSRGVFTFTDERDAIHFKLRWVG